MLITAETFFNDKNILNCSSFVIYGGEPLQTHECLQLIKAKLQNLGYTETEVLEPQGGAAWEDILTSQDNLSLFATKKIIVLPINGSIDKANSKALAEFTNNIPSYIAFIVIANNLAQKDLKTTTWIKNINTKGMIINASEIHASKLKAWIKNRLSLFDLGATEEVIELLAFYYEGNISACAQTIEKFSLYFTYPATQNSTIELNTTNKNEMDKSYEVNNDVVLNTSKPKKYNLTRTDVEKFTNDSARFTVFDFTNALFAFDSKKCFHILLSLKEQNIEPTLIIWAITREIRTLIKIATSIQHGSSLESSCKNFMVWDSKIPLIKTTLARLGTAKLKLILYKANTMDAIIKNIVNENFWDSLQSLCLTVLGFNSIPLEETHT